MITNSPEPQSESFVSVLYEVRDGVATITINRPQVYNAFDGDTLRELSVAMALARDDSNVGVVVLTGAGEKAFCAGGDVNWEGTDALADGPQREMRAFYDVMLSVLKPVIARVNGYSIGGGNHLSYLCDLTIAADHAIFGQNGARVASAAQGWEISYLVRVIGAKRAREMWYLCRRYSAAQMLDWGLVNAVVPLEDLDAEVGRWCEELLALSPTVLKLLKKSFLEEFSAIRETQRESYLPEINPGFYGGEENLEGINAFLEKRPADFSRWR
jgi:2-ketocyclohexanecarboxyl-CoA hydrolase